MSHRITVFTPTFNREKTLKRVYNSLLNQTYKDFIWIIVDDGSKDNTKNIVNDFVKENKIDIKYIYQENQGKHIAINTALNVVDTEFFIIADSDDSFLPESLEVFVKYWEDIPYDKRKEYKGIIARCFDSKTKKPIGKFFDEKVVDCTELEAKFKYKLSGEKWSFFRTEVMKEFSFPEIEGLKFYPETIIWQKMSRKYKTRYINIPLREYFRDQENALTNRKNTRYKENVYLWEHIINNIYDYFWYNPKLFIKAHIGITRDGLLNGFKLKDILKLNNKFYKRILTFLLYPLGYILYKRMTNDE